MPEYINPPGPPIDPVDITDQASEYIRTFFPNWDPNEAQLAWVIILALALRIAELDDLARMIPKSVFRNYGLKIINLPPVEAAPATGTVTITVRDTVGYTLTADDVRINIEDTDGDLHEFVASSDVEIVAGQSTATNVAVTATIPGVQANGITNGTATLAESLDPVIAVAHTGTTSGGLDAEEDEEYLNRLTRRLGLIPRPVTAQDYATLVLVQYPEVWRAFAIDNYAPGVNSKQNIVTNADTTPSATVTINGVAVTSVPFNVTASAMQTMINGTIGINKVVVTGVAVNTGSGLTFEFIGAWGEQPISAITVGSGWKLGGVAATTTVTSIQLGVVPNVSLAKNITLAGIYAEGTAISSQLKNSILAYLQLQRMWGFIVNVVDATFTSVDVTTTFTVLPGYVASDIEAAVEVALTNYFNAAVYGAIPGDARSSYIQPTVYLWELVTLVNNVLGVDRVVTLVTGLDGGSQTGSDKSLSGTIPLPAAGTMAATAV